MSQRLSFVCSVPQLCSMRVDLPGPAVMCGSPKTFLVAFRAKSVVTFRCKTQSSFQNYKVEPQITAIAANYSQSYDRFSLLPLEGPALGKGVASSSFLPAPLCSPNCFSELPVG